MSKNSNLNPYEELANAIVLQAVRDYREAVKKLSRGRKNHDAQDTKEECLRFFRSKWFSLPVSYTHLTLPTNSRV